jgi:hypothetical protein
MLMVADTLKTHHRNGREFPMRFRFAIRDLLWLTVVVALVVAWRVDRSYWQKNWNADHEAIIRQVGDLQAELTASQARERRLESQLNNAAIKPTW